MSIRLPAFLDDLKKSAPDEYDGIRTRFLLRLAALYHSPFGQLKTLSVDLGYHENTLAGITSISPELAVKLEEALGADLFPREMLNPIFAKE